MTFFRNSLICMIAVSGLAGCGEKESAKPATPAASAKADAPTAAVSSRPTLPQFPRGALAARDQYTPLAIGERAEGEKAIEQMSKGYIQLAWSSAKRDDAQLAYDTLPEYRREKDTFKQSDIIKANASKLDETFNENHGKNKFALDLTKYNVAIEKYDVEKKGFSVWPRQIEDDWTGLGKPNEGQLHPEPAWGARIVGLPNPDTENKLFYKPKDENEARELESALSTFRTSYASREASEAKIKVLGHTVATIPAPDNKNVQLALFVVDGIEFIHPTTKKVLFTMDRDQIGKSMDVMCKSTIKALDLKEPERADNGWTPVKDC